MSRLGELWNEEYNKLKAPAEETSNTSDVTHDPVLGDISYTTGRVHHAASQLGRGVTDFLASSIEGLGGRGEEKLRDYLGDEVENEQTILHQVGKFVRSIGEELDVNPEYMEDFWTSAVPQGFGSYGAYAILDKIPGGKLAAAAGHAQTEARAYRYQQEAKGEPIDEDVEEQVFLANLPAGMLEMAPYQRLKGLFKATRNIPLSELKKVKRAQELLTKRGFYKSIAKEGAKQAAIEGGQEMAQDEWANLVARDIVGFDKERQFFEDFTGAGAGAVVGGVTGAAVQGIGLKMRLGGLTQQQRDAVAEALKNREKVLEKQDQDRIKANKERDAIVGQQYDQEFKRQQQEEKLNQARIKTIKDQQDLFEKLPVPENVSPITNEPWISDDTRKAWDEAEATIEMVRMGEMSRAEGKKRLRGITASVLGRNRLTNRNIEPKQAVEGTRTAVMIRNRIAELEKEFGPVQARFDEGPSLFPDEPVAGPVPTPTRTPPSAPPVPTADQVDSRVQAQEQVARERGEATARVEEKSRIISKKDGSPFKREQDAKAALKAQGRGATHEVSPIDGGFVLTPIGETPVSKLTPETTITPTEPVVEEPVEPVVEEAPTSTKPPIYNTEVFSEVEKDNMSPAETFGVHHDWNLPEGYSYGELMAYGNEMMQRADDESTDGSEYYDLLNALIEANPELENLYDTNDELSYEDIANILMGVGSRFNEDDLSFYLELQRQGVPAGKTMREHPEYGPLFEKIEKNSGKFVEWVPSPDTLKELAAQYPDTKTPASTQDVQTVQKEAEEKRLAAIKAAAEQKAAENRAAEQARLNAINEAAKRQAERRAELEITGETDERSTAIQEAADRIEKKKNAAARGLEKKQQETLNKTYATQAAIKGALTRAKLNKDEYQFEQTEDGRWRAVRGSATPTAPGPNEGFVRLATVQKELESIALNNSKYQGTFSEDIKTLDELVANGDDKAARTLLFKFGIRDKKARNGIINVIREAYSTVEPTATAPVTPSEPVSPTGPTTPTASPVTTAPTVSQRFEVVDEQPATPGPVEGETITLYKGKKKGRTEGKKYEGGRFYTQSRDLALRYAKTTDHPGEVEEITFTPQQIFNVDEVQNWSQQQKDVFGQSLVAFLQKRGIKIADSYVYDVLNGETDFAYPIKADSDFLQSLGYDSVFYSQEGGEQVDSWFILTQPDTSAPTHEQSANAVTNGRTLHSVRDNKDIKSIINTGLKKGSNVGTDQSQAVSGPIVLVYDKNDIDMQGKGYQANEGVVYKTKRTKPVAVLVNTDEFVSDRLVGVSDTEQGINELLGEVEKLYPEKSEEEISNLLGGFSSYYIEGANGPRGRDEVTMFREEAKEAFPKHTHQQVSSWAKKLANLMDAQIVELQGGSKGQTAEQKIDEAIKDIPTDIPIYSYTINEDGAMVNFKPIRSPRTPTLIEEVQAEQEADRIADEQAVETKGPGKYLERKLERLYDHIAKRNERIPLTVGIIEEQLQLLSKAINKETGTIPSTDKINNIIKTIKDKYFPSNSISEVRNFAEQYYKYTNPTVAVEQIQEEQNDQVAPAATPEIDRVNKEVKDERAVAKEESTQPPRSGWSDELELIETAEQARGLSDERLKDLLDDYGIGSDKAEAQKFGEDGLRELKLAEQELIFRTKEDEEVTLAESRKVKRLTEEDEQLLKDIDEPNYDDDFPTSAITEEERANAKPFSTSIKQRLLKLKRFNNINKKIRNNLPGLTIRFYNNESDLDPNDPLEAKLIAYLRADPRRIGAQHGLVFNYKTDNMFIPIFGDYIGSAYQVETTILHELVGHYGFAHMFGFKRYDDFLDALLDDPAFAKAAFDLRKQWSRVNLSPVDGQETMTINEVGAVVDRASMRILMDEYIALNAEEFSSANTRVMYTHQNKLWNRITAFFRAMFRAIGFTETAKNITQKDIMHLIGLSYNNVMKSNDNLSLFYGRVGNLVEYYKANGWTLHDAIVDFSKNPMRRVAEALRDPYQAGEGFAIDAAIRRLNLTTKIMERLPKKPKILIASINQIMNQRDINQYDKDLFNEILDKHRGEKFIEYNALVNEINDRLLPLEIYRGEGGYPDKPTDEMRRWADYGTENIFDSPHAYMEDEDPDTLPPVTLFGSVISPAVVNSWDLPFKHEIGNHWDNPYQAGHTRMVYGNDNSINIFEVQSDLFQNIMKAINRSPEDIKLLEKDRDFFNTILDKINNIDISPNQEYIPIVEITRYFSPAMLVHSGVFDRAISSLRNYKKIINAIQDYNKLVPNRDINQDVPKDWSSEENMKISQILAKAGRYSSGTNRSRDTLLEIIDLMKSISTLQKINMPINKGEIFDISRKHLHLRLKGEYGLDLDNLISQMREGEWSSESELGRLERIIDVGPDYSLENLIESNELKAKEAESELKGIDTAKSFYDENTIFLDNIFKRMMIEHMREAAQRRKEKVRLLDEKGVAKVEGWPFFNRYIVNSFKGKEVSSNGIRLHPKMLNFREGSKRLQDETITLTGNIYQGHPMSMTDGDKIWFVEVRDEGGNKYYVRGDRVFQEGVENTKEWDDIIDFIYDKDKMKNHFDRIHYAEHDLIYLRHKNLAKWFKSRYKAEKRVDKNQNTWYEAKVDPNSANESLVVLSPTQVDSTEVDGMQRDMSNGFSSELRKSAYQQKVDGWARKIRNKKQVRLFYSMGKLNNEGLLKSIRQRALATIGQFEEIGKKFAKNMSGMSDSQKEAIYQYFTTQGANVWDLPIEPRVAPLIQDAKDSIEDLGKFFVEEHGILDEETYNENVGKYLPRMYLKYIDQYRGGGKRTSFMDFLKKRTDMPEGWRDFYGEIKDPKFVVADTIIKMGRDHALLSYFKELARVGPEYKWVLDDAYTIEFQGRQVPVKEARTMLDAARQSQQLGQSWYDGVNVIERQQNLAQWIAEMETAIAEHEATVKQDVKEMYMATVPDATEEGFSSVQWQNFLQKNYRQIPNQKRYGDLAGKWVRKEIYNDLDESIWGYSDQESKEFMDKLKTKAEKGHAVWKALKVPFNIPSWFRNGFGNLTLLDLSSKTSWAKLTQMSLEELVIALKEYNGSDLGNGLDNKYYRIAKSQGLYATTFSTTELRILKDEFIDKLTRDKILEGLQGLEPNERTAKDLYKLLSVSSHELTAQAFEKVSEIYGGMEGVFKTAALRDYIQTWEKESGRRYDDLNSTEQKALEEAAALHAQKWIFDYSDVPNFLRKTRRYLLGAPFLTFTYKSFPRVIEGAVRRPQKMAKYVMLPYILSALSMYVNDWDDDDMEEINGKLPNWMKEKNSIYGLPWKDANGNIQMMDFGYFFPWEPFMNMASSSIKNFEAPDVGSAVISSGKTAINIVQDLGFFGGPIPDLMTAALTNKDTFTGADIRTPGASGKEQFFDIATYMANLGLPTFLSPVGFAGHLYKNVKSPLDEYGDDKETGMQVAGRAFGINIYPVDPKKSHIKNLKSYTYKINEAKRAMTKAIKDKNLSREQRVSLIKEHKKIIQYRIQQRADYLKGG